MQEIPTPICVSAVALVDEGGCIFLQQRPGHKQHGGLWEFPGGKQEAGESPKSAARRELLEELAIRIEEDSLQFVGEVQEAIAGRNAIVIMLYTCRVWHGPLQLLDAAQAGWFLPDQMDDLPMPPLDIALISSLRAMLAAPGA